MTKRSLFYILATSIVFLIYLCYCSYAFFLIFLILVLIPVLSILYTFLLKDKVTITLQMKEDVSIRGDSNDFQVEVNNQSIFPLPNIIIHLDFSYSNSSKDINAFFHLDARSMDRTKVNGKITLEHAGELQLNINHSFVYDPLKLVKLQLKCSSSKKMLVMPVLITPDYDMLYLNLEDTDESQEYSQNKSGEDSSEIFDIRDYQNGDAINRIHWKAAVKQDQLMVKEFSYPIYRSNCVLVELTQANDVLRRRGLDAVYEMVYAIGNLACNKEKQFKLAYHCNMTHYLKIYDILNEEDLVAAIQSMIREPAYMDNQSLYDYLDSNLCESYKLFYVTASMEPEMLDLLEQSEVGNVSIFHMKDSSACNDAGDVTRINDGIMVNVDRNDIKQGLSNVMI